MSSMELDRCDKIYRSRDLVKGMLDTMIYIETAQQDKLIPITVLCPFEEVLEKVYSLLAAAGYGCAEYSLLGEAMEGK